MEQALAYLLNQIIFIERDIESVKIDLALRSDFNIPDLISLFKTCADTIKMHDFVTGLKRLDYSHISCDEV
jgi:hypothetical protein